MDRIRNLPNSESIRERGQMAGMIFGAGSLCDLFSVDVHEAVRALTSGPTEDARMMATDFGRVAEDFNKALEKMKQALPDNSKDVE